MSKITPIAVARIFRRTNSDAVSFDFLLSSKSVYAYRKLMLPPSAHFATDWHYRKLYIEISSRGYRKSEPDGGPREVSQVLQKVFNALREEGVTKHDVATALHVHPEDVDELVFGLALPALEGDGRRAAALGRRPKLTVVASKEG